MKINIELNLSPSDAKKLVETGELTITVGAKASTKNPPTANDSWTAALASEMVDLMYASQNIPSTQAGKQKQLVIAKELLKKHPEKLLRYAIENAPKYNNGKNIYSLNFIYHIIEKAKADLQAQEALAQRTEKALSKMAETKEDTPPPSPVQLKLSRSLPSLEEFVGDVDSISDNIVDRLAGLKP